MVSRARAPTGPVRAIRALVTDVDGTLTDRDRGLSPRAVAAVEAVEARGIPVLLATGNVLPIALALNRSLGLSGPVVAENGGILYYRRDGVDVVERFSRRAPAMAAFRHLKDAGLPVRRLFTDRWRETEVALEANVSASAARRHLAGWNVRVEATGYALHLMERGRGKLPTVRRALALLGLELGDCLVAGDGDNDVGMLRAAGWSVSFPNASPAARRAAKRLTRASYSRGFVEALIGLGVVPARVGREGVG